MPSRLASLELSENHDTNGPMVAWRTSVALFLASFLVYNLNFRCIWAYDTQPARAIGAFCFPSGRRIADYDQMWGELAYLVELRAGPSDPTFLRWAQKW
jgi:hypothetical protein